jgi:ubiquinone/menaquinone biosynthesis C-methylase UbiE
MNASSTTVRGLVLRGHARFYDWVVRLMTLTSGRSYVAALLDAAQLGADDGAILDVGCGTGSLALASARRAGPHAKVFGLDASEQMLELAARKARRMGARVTFVQGTVEALPFEYARFDLVFSTLMLHHLPRPARLACAREARRVLKPGGRFVVSDFETPARAAKGLLAHMHRHGGVRQEEVRAMLLDAGFAIDRSGELGVSNLHFTIARPREP